MMDINKKILAGIGLLAGALGLFLWTRKAEAACEEGQTKCVGVDLYACVDGVWQLVEANSPQCITPECESGQIECRNRDLWACVNGKWQLEQVDSPSCGYEPPPAECLIKYITSEFPHGILWRVVVNGEVIFQKVYGGGGFRFPLTVSPGNYHIEVTECQKWVTVSYPPWLICANSIGPFTFNFTLAGGETATCDANTGIVTIT